MRDVRRRPGGDRPGGGRGGRRRGMGESLAAAGGDPNGERPALVNVVATRCRPDGAAYSATILDLAARGHLVLTEPQPGHLACELPPAAPSDSETFSETFPSERIVLKNVL